MSSRLFVGLLGGLSYVLVASLSHAQCTKDTDCKGDRVCDGGACVAPAQPPAAATAPEAAQPGVQAPQPAAPAAAPVPVATAPSQAQPVTSSEVVDTRRKYQRHSTGMMVGGIVMTSFVPIALLVSLVASVAKTSCNVSYDYSSNQYSRDTHCDRYNPTIYGGLISAVALAGAGIPLIVIGSKKEPVSTAQVTPWAAPNAGGLSLRLQL